MIVKSERARICRMLGTADHRRTKKKAGQFALLFRIRVWVQEDYRAPMRR